MTLNICDYLRDRIKSFLAARGESIRWLCKQTGADYSTIYRLHSGEQKRLSFTNAKRILYVIEPANADSILHDYFPRETSETRELGAKTESDALSAILAEDLQLYKVYVFAEMEGIERWHIKEQFGNEGLKHLDKLLRLGILVEGSNFKSTMEGRSYPPEDVIKKTAIHHFHMVPLNVPGSIIEDIRGGLSDEGIRDLYEAVVELREKALKIMKEKKGNRLVVMSAIAGPGEIL
ncbi:helix-turn-helix domain-containing protein [Oligoflexus tunisiensis]|uniref:helix-turn-helix domain-containing protein n=1 Tax=Oligoflexus tunisiensis TaxID=708132 RepID=UPI00114D2E81|nr:helix-turn-helix transcriptional regulator [Oligoflexus tunisiensis]